MTPAGRLLSVNVGELGSIELDGRAVQTGIDKEPVAGRVAVHALGLAGDHQADRRVHGGPDQALYAYAAEDYSWWSSELGRELSPGAFGENLTITGVDVSRSLVGERWRVGARLAYLTAVGDQTGTHLPVVDLGPWVRVEFMPGDIKPFADLGLGASHGWMRNDNLKLSGFGWHLMLGGGVGYAVTADIALHAGLYFGYQNFPKVSGDIEYLGPDAEFEGNGSIDRLMLAFGIQF